MGTRVPLQDALCVQSLSHQRNNFWNNFEVRNFLGQRIAFIAEAPEGVKLTKSADVKDQLELEGNDIVAISLVASRIKQMVNVKNKDIRKFLDGIYVSEKGPIP